MDKIDIEAMETVFSEIALSMQTTFDKSKPLDTLGYIRWLGSTMMSKTPPQGDRDGWCTFCVGIAAICVQFCLWLREQP